MPEFPMPKFEDLIFDAVVRQFFEPDIVGFNFGAIPGAPYTNGMPQMGYTPQYGEAPLVRMARTLYANNNNKLAEMVWAKIDIEQLAANVAKLCVEKIGVREETYGRRDTDELVKIREMVRGRIVDELTRRALADLDHQAEVEKLRKLAAETAGTVVPAESEATS